MISKPDKKISVYIPVYYDFGFLDATTLSLPVSFGHTEQEIKKVIEVMNKF